MTADRTPPPELRQAVLAVAVLDDVDLVPRDAGVLLPGAPPVEVRWGAVADAVRGASGAPALEPTWPGARARVALLLRLHRLVADLGPRAAEDLRPAARALALPRDHVLHPGDAWVRWPVRGGAADAGVGLHGVVGGDDAVVPLLPDVAEAAGIPVGRWWPGLLAHAERMGGLATERLRRDAGSPREVLRPVGGCDVPTLLLSAELRAHLAASDGTGMRAVAVPVRTRGWVDVRQVDPAFVGAAWSATEEVDRGFSRPLLVTADDVAPAPHRTAGC